MAEQNNFPWEDEQSTPEIQVGEQLPTPWGTQAGEKIPTTPSMIESVGIKEERTPHISRQERFITKGFFDDADKRLAWLYQKHPEWPEKGIEAVVEDGRILVKGPGELQYKPMDVDFFGGSVNEITEDMTDLAVESAQAILEEGAATVGGVAGLLSPVPGGAAIGAAAGGFAGGVVSSALKQAIAPDVEGFEKEIDTNEAIKNGMFSMASTTLLGANIAFDNLYKAVQVPLSSSLKKKTIKNASEKVLSQNIAKKGLIGEGLSKAGKFLEKMPDITTGIERDVYLDYANRVKFYKNLDDASAETIAQQAGKDLVAAYEEFDSNFVDEYVKYMKSTNQQIDISNVKAVYDRKLKKLVQVKDWNKRLSDEYEHILKERTDLFNLVASPEDVTKINKELDTLLTESEEIMSKNKISPAEYERIKKIGEDVKLLKSQKASVGSQLIGPSGKPLEIPNKIDAEDFFRWKKMLSSDAKYYKAAKVTPVGKGARFAETTENLARDAVSEINKSMEKAVSNYAHLRKMSRDVIDMDYYISNNFYKVDPKTMKKHYEDISHKTLMSLDKNQGLRKKIQMLDNVFASNKLNKSATIEKARVLKTHNALYQRTFAKDLTEKPVRTTLRGGVGAMLGYGVGATVGGTTMGYPGKLMLGGVGSLIGAVGLSPEGWKVFYAHKAGPKNLFQKLYTKTKAAALKKRTRAALITGHALSETPAKRTNMFTEDQQKQEEQSFPWE